MCKHTGFFELMKTLFTFPSWSKTKWHILVWIVALLYLLFTPSIKYLYVIDAGKPAGMLNSLPENTGKIRYNIEDLKYWSGNVEVHQENETYALWGWTFLDTGQKIRLSEFNRFIVIYNENDNYLFSTQVFKRRGIQKTFDDLGLDDLTNAGFFAVISRNALPKGMYKVGLFFRNKQDDSMYFTSTNVTLTRTPNHIIFSKD